MTKMIACDQIVGGDNVRNEKETALSELAESINENGLLQPITVRKIDGGKYEVINGHRRFAAVRLNGEPFIECNILEVTDKEKLILQVVENVQRTNMSAYELVEVFDSMKEKYHCTNRAIAHYFHKSEQWVNDNYCAKRLLEKEYEGVIPEDKKKLSAGIIKNMVTHKRKGNNVSYECKGFNVKHHGHTFMIHCSAFEAEQELMEFIKGRLCD